MSDPHEVLRGPVNTPTEGEGGLYAAPNSTFDTPPPYEWGYRPGGAHADGGSIRPSDAYFNDPTVGTYPPLNFENLIKSGAMRVTQPGNGRDGGFDASDDPDLWSLVSHANDTAQDSPTRAWPDKPSSYESASRSLNEPGPLYDGKYRQLVWSAQQRGMPARDMYLPSAYQQADTNYAHGGPVEMALGGTTPVSTGGQYQPRKSEGPGFFRNQNNYDNSSAGGINFIKNLVQDLSPAQREAQRLVSEATRKSGKEALIFGRGENPNDLAKLVHGTYDSVNIPDNYKQYAGQSTDPFFTLHSHPTNTLSPSLADLRIWGTRYPGTLGLPYQSMLINASPQDSLLRIGTPGKYMTSEAASRVDDVLNLKNKSEDLLAYHGFMDPRIKEFIKANKLPDLAHEFHAEAAPMPGVTSYLNKKYPGSGQDASVRDLYGGHFLKQVSDLGIPVDVSAEHRIAGTPYLAQDVWPEFSKYVEKYALPKADGGPVEMQVGGADKIKDAVGFLRRSIMPHAREKSMVPPNRDIESRYWDHKKPPDLDTITADYGVNHLPVDVPTMKIEDIKGGRVFAIPHDRSATDLLLGGYNGNTFANPVTSPGGPLYAFGRNPEAVTASGEKVIKNLHESARRSADEGKTPYLAPWLMGPHGVDFSTHMNEAVVQSLPFLKVPSAKKDEVNAMLSTVFKGFPGIDHNDLAQYLHSMLGTTRRDLPKLLDKGEMVNAGLDVGGLRAALTEPSLLHAPYGSSGAAISRIDPSKSPTMFGYPNHPSYPWQLQGTPVGGLDPLVPSQILYPDFYRNLPPDTQLGPKGRPVNNRRAFEMSSMKGGVSQDVNDEVINGVNEYQEYMRKLRGWKEGGTVEDEYHPIWQQSFAGGGQPEMPDKYDNAFDAMYPWLSMDASRFAPTLPVPDQDYDPEPNSRNTIEGNLVDSLYGGRITPTAEERYNNRKRREAYRAEHPEGVYSTDPLRGLLGMIGKQRAGWSADQAEMYGDESEPGQRAIDQIGHLGRTFAHDVTGGLSDKLVAALSPGAYSANVPREAAATRSAREQLDPYVRAPMSVLPYMLSPAQQLAQYGMTTASNLMEPAHGAIDWARKQFDKSMLGHVRPVSEAVYGGMKPPLTRPQWDTRDSYNHGGPVGYAGGGHAKDTGNTFDFLGPFGAGLNLIADGAGAIFNGEDFELDKALGYLGEIGGSLVAPGVGGALGRGAGTAAAHLIEPGEGGDIGQDALRAGYGALRGGAGMFFAHGGSTGFLPQGDEEDPNDLTRFLSPQVNPSKQPGPMDWAGAGGIPGAISPPLNANNGQVARDAAERQRLMQMAEGASRQALQGQGSKGGGGGGGMGDLTQIASMAMKFLPMMMAAEGGPVPNQDGEQPWMYGDGALMARGGYLRGCGGMNG